MKTVDIFDEENSIVVDDQYDTTTFDFYPENKKFKISMSVKDDCYYNDAIVEYRISTNPVEMYMRTLESSHEPPLEYSIKDGVVLESEIIKDKEGWFLENAKKRISDLKKEVEWSKVPLPGQYEVNLFLLSKHPEILSKEDYRKFLRQSVEKIKIGISKVEEAVKKDTNGLEIYTSESGINVWYQPPNKLEEKEIEEYWKLPEEKRLESNYGKKFEYAEKFNDSLFKEDSPKYIGISEYELRNSTDLLNYIEKLLENKISSTNKEGSFADTKDGGNRTKWITVIILSIIALSWGVWTAIGVFILGSIIINIMSK